MYSELYAAWQAEVSSSELGSLPSDFYGKVSAYLVKVREQDLPLDKNDPRAALINVEIANAKRMVQGLMFMRLRKILAKILAGEPLPSEGLALEEGKLFFGVNPFVEEFRRFADNIVQGQTVKLEKPTQEKSHERATLRFLREVPSIIGADMKTYGPFMVEDVASLPIENAKIMVKQKLAEFVDVT